MKPAPLVSRADVNEWAVISSAPAVAFQSTLLFKALEDGEFGDATCPAKKVDGNTTTWTGDCTDDEGMKWFGKLSDKRDAAGSTSGTLSFDGFGAEGMTECGSSSAKTHQRLSGTFKQGGTATDATFDVDLSIEQSVPNEETCAIEKETLAWAYQAKVNGSSDPARGRGTWSGKGRVGVLTKGVVNVETVDEVIDRDACAAKPMSGTTTIKSGEHEAVVTYDGASNCNLAASATWSLDGVAQSQPLLGLNCSAMGAGSLSAWGLLALGGLALRRRRNA